MSFWSRFSGFFKRAAAGIFDLVKRFVQSEDVRDLLSTALGQIVQSAVVQLQYENLSSADKREAAVQQVIGQAKASGLEFKESVVRLLLELAVQRLKSASL